MSSNPGLLRLKGSQTPGKVSKKKKKIQPTPTTSTTAEPAASPPSHLDPTPTTTKEAAKEPSPPPEARAADEERAAELTSPLPAKGDEDDQQSSHKTPAELDRELRRRQRLNHRLEREGSKTHKQRVEELNRYLSGLSEHHDMPRIGPG